MKHSTRSSPPNAALAALLAAGLMLGAAQNAAAAGTAAGTTISNSATLAYDVSGVPQTDITSTAATFVVDEKVNLTVAGGVTTPVVPGATAQVTTFTVTNNANSPLDFSLASNQVAAGDQFDATACTVVVESGGVAGYDPTDTASFVDELAADATATVYAVCNIPATVVNTNTALVGLTAVAVGNFNAAGYVATPTTPGAAITATAGADTAGAVDIVFADIAGTEAGDAARDAKHSARDTYTVVTAALTVTKTATLLCDPFNGVTNPKNIPGAITQWSIAVQNTGAAAATLTTVTDTLAASLAHDANLVTGLTAAACVTTGVPENAAGKGFKVTTSAARNIGGTATVTTGYFTSANDADGVENNAGAIMATFATVLPTDGGHATAGLLNAGETVTVIFNTTVQ